MEDTTKILVRVIDGANTLVPIDAKCYDDDHYEILDDIEYRDLDASILFEYYPGDIVKGDFHIFPVGDNIQAHHLVKAGPFPDRSYLEFKFRATLRILPSTIDSAEKFHAEIERIKKEKSEGVFFYRGIIELVEYFDRLTK